MPGRDGKRRIGAQGDRTADLARELVKPSRILFKHRDHRWMSGQSNGTDFTRGAAEKRPSLERRSVSGEFEQRCMKSWPDDMQESEAVDGCPLKRLGQCGVDRCGYL